MAQAQQGAGKKEAVHFSILVRELEKLVPPDQKVELHSLYKRMKDNVFSRADFILKVKSLAGSQVVLDAVRNMQHETREVNPKKEPQSQEQPPVNSSAVNGPLDSPASKKRKVESLEHLNDLSIVGDVNLKEEEKRMLTAPRNESRFTPEMRQRFLEKEGRLFLEKTPLHVKVQAIAAKDGIKSLSEDVERCLSMSAEECLCNFLRKAAKMPKQRCDGEKDRRNFILSSAKQRTITQLRKEQHGFQQRKQAEEAERQRKLHEKGSSILKYGKPPANEKSEKPQKTEQKYKDLTIREAANRAACQAVGLDDVASKWMLMAEERKKQLTASGVQTSQGQGATVSGDRSVSGVPTWSTVPPGRSITLKDLITCLETEPSMCRSALLYKLLFWAVTRW